MPYRITFFTVEENRDIGWFISDIVIDFIFILDIVFTFYTAYYDEDYLLVEDRLLIAKSYLKSWFLIDLLSVLPIDILLRNNNYDSLMRIARL